MRYLRTLIFILAGLVWVRTLQPDAAQGVSQLARGLSQVKSEYQERVTQFFKAIYKNESKEVEKFLKKGFSPNTRRDDGTSAIDVALQKSSKREGKNKALFLLIKHPEFDYDNLGKNRWNQLFRGARYMQSTTLRDIIYAKPSKKPKQTLYQTFEQ